MKANLSHKRAIDESQVLEENVEKKIKIDKDHMFILSDFKRSNQGYGGHASIKNNDMSDIEYICSGDEWLNIAFSPHDSTFANADPMKKKITFNSIPENMQVKMRSIQDNVNTIVFDRALDIFNKNIRSKKEVADKFWPFFKESKPPYKNLTLKVSLCKTKKDCLKIYELDEDKRELSVCPWELLDKGRKCQIKFKIQGIWTKSIGWGITTTLTHIMVKKQKLQEECPFVSKENGYVLVKDDKPDFKTDPFDEPRVYDFND
jgi:hypothetical protein